MGRVETEQLTRAQVSKERVQRAEHVYDVLRDTIGGLLLRGGAISKNGVIIAYRYDELNPEHLTRKQRETLILRRIISDSGGKLKDVLPNNQLARRITKVFIVRPNTLKYLGIGDPNQTSRRYGIAIVGVWPHIITSVSDNQSLTEAVSNYIKPILLNEELVDPKFVEGRRYANELLKDLALSMGQGNLRGSNSPRNSA